MTIRQTLSSKLSQRARLKRLLYSGLFLAAVGLAVGAVTIVAIWQYNSGFALLCIPMVASVLTALTLMLALPAKSRRRRLR